MASPGNGSDGLSKPSEPFGGPKHETGTKDQKRQPSLSLPAFQGSESGTIQRQASQRQSLNVFEGEEGSHHDDKLSAVDENSAKADKTSNRTQGGNAAVHSSCMTKTEKTNTLPSDEDPNMEDVKHLPLGDSDTEEDICVQVCFEAEVYDSRKSQSEPPLKTHSKKSLKLDAYQWNYLKSQTRLWTSIEKEISGERLMACICNITEHEHNQIQVFCRHNRRKTLCSDEFGVWMNQVCQIFDRYVSFILWERLYINEKTFDDAWQKLSEAPLVDLNVKFIAEMNCSSIVIVTDKDNQDKVFPTANLELRDFIRGTSQNAAVKENGDKGSTVPDPTNPAARVDVTEQPEEDSTGNQEQHGSDTQVSANQRYKANSPSQPLKDGSKSNMSGNVVSAEKGLEDSTSPPTAHQLEKGTGKHRSIKIALIIDADWLAKCKEMYPTWTNVTFNLDKMTEHIVMADQRLIICTGYNDCVQAFISKVTDILSEKPVILEELASHNPVTKDLTLPEKNLHLLLTNTEVQSQICKQLLALNFVCSVEKNQLRIWHKLYGDPALAKDIISRAIRHVVVPLQSCQEAQFKGLKEFIEAHSGLVEVYQHEGNNAWVAFSSLEIDSINSRIKEYEETQLIGERFVRMPEDEYQFLKCYGQEAIRLLTTNENAVVTLTEYDQSCGFHIRGPRKAILWAMDVIKKITPAKNAFPVEHVHLEWLRSSRGKEFMQHIQATKKCIITTLDSIDSTFEIADVPKVIQSYSPGSGATEKHARLATGDIRTWQPDVIAIPVWGERNANKASLEAVLQKNGIDVDLDAILKEISSLSFARDYLVYISDAKIDEAAVDIAFVLMPPEWGNNENKERHKILTATSDLLKEVYKRFGRKRVVLSLKDIYDNATEKGVKAVLWAVSYVFHKEEKLSVEVFLLIEDLELAANLRSLFMKAMGPGGSTSQDEKRKRVKLSIGKLAKAKVDVLVNTSGTRLELSQGAVSKSLLKEAGKEIQKECVKKYPSGIKLGDIAKTDTGNIKDCKAIYHGALPPNEKTMTEEAMEKHLLNFVYLCLQRASEAGHSSIAFPAVGAGNLGYPATIVSKAMFNAVETFYTIKPASELHVKFVLFEGNRDVIQHFYAEEVARDYEVTCRGGKCNVLRYIPKEGLLLQIIQGDLRDYKGTDEVHLCLEEDKASDHLKKCHMTTSEERRVTHELTHSKSARISSHSIGASPLLVHVYNRDKILETLKRILKKNQENIGIQVIIPSTGLGGFASHLNQFLQDTKKFDGRLCTMTVVVQSESLFQEFSDLPKANSWWQSWFYSPVIPEKITRTSVSTVGAIKIIASEEEAVTQAYETVMKMIAEKLYAAGKSDVLSSNIEDEYVNVDSLDVNEQKNEASACLFIPYQKNSRDVLMTLFEEKISFKGFLKPNLSYHPNHEVLVCFCPKDAALAKEALAKYGAERLPTNLSRGATLEITPEERDQINEKEFKRATGMSLSNDAFVQGNFAQIIAAERFLDKKFSSTPSEDVVPFQTPSHKDTKHSGTVQKMSSTQYRAASHLIGVSPLADAVLEKKELVSADSTEQLSLLFHDNHGANQIKQRILGFNNKTVAIQGTITADKERALKEVMSENKVYVELSPDKKSVVIVSEEWNELSAAKKKVQVKFGQVKPSSRDKRTFAENPSTPRPAINNPLEPSSTPEQRIDKQDDQVFKLGCISVLVYAADITKLSVDAIVNAANKHLSHGSGVARAILDAAGNALDDEGRQYVHNNGPIPVSGVVRTTAGRMPCRMVLHAVGPAWFDYQDYEKKRCQDDLFRTILRCLIEANNVKVGTVAIPAISSGIFHVPKEKCCDAYMRATKLFSQWTGSQLCLKEVHFVDKSESMLKMIASTFSESMHSTFSPTPEEERFMNECMKQGVRQRSRSRGRQASSTRHGGQTTNTVREPDTVSTVTASYTYSENTYMKISDGTGDSTALTPLTTGKGEETQDDPCKITIRAEGSDGHHYEDTLPDIGLSVWFHLKQCQNYLNFESKLKRLSFDIEERSNDNIVIRYTGSTTLANNMFMSKCREVHQIIREHTEKYCHITIIEDEEQKDFIVRNWTKTGLSQSRKATAHRARSGCLFIVAENHYRNDVDREVLKLKEQYKVYVMQLQGDVGNLSAAEGNCNWPVQPEVNARYNVNWEPGQELLEEEGGIVNVLLQTTIPLTSCQQKFLDSHQEAKNYVVSFFNKKDIQCAFDFNDRVLVLTAKKEWQPITTSVLEDLVSSSVLPFTPRYWYSKRDVLGLMEEKFQSSKGKFMFFPDNEESSITVVATNDIFPHIYNVIHMITVDVVEKTIDLDREQLQHLLLMKKWKEFEPLLVDISANVVLIRTLPNDRKFMVLVLGTNAIVEEFCSEIEGLVSSNTCTFVITKLPLPADKIQLLHTCPAAVKFIEQAVKKKGYEVRLEGKDINISSHSSIHEHALQHFQDLIISETIMQQDESVSDLLTLDELKDMLIKAHEVHQEKIVIVIDKMKQSLTLTGTVDIFSDVRKHLREIQIQTMSTKTEEEIHLSADHMKYIQTQGKSELETVARDVKVSVKVAENHGIPSVKLTGLQPGVKKVKEWLIKDSTVMGRKKMSEATSQVFPLQGLMQKLLKTCPNALCFIQEEYEKKGYRFDVDPEFRNATVIVTEPEDLSDAKDLASLCTKKLSVDFGVKGILLTPKQAKALLCEHEPEYSQQMVLFAHDAGKMFKMIGTRDIAGQVIKTFEQILYDHAYDSIFLYLVGEENSVLQEQLEKMKQEIRSSSVEFLCTSEKVQIHGAKASVRHSFRTLCSSLAELKQNGKIQVPPRLRMCDQDVSQLIHLALQKCGGIRQYLTFHFEKHGFDFELSDNRLRLYAGSITALQTVREVFESLILERNFSLLNEAVVQMHGMQYVARELVNNPSWEGKLITHTDDKLCQLSIVCTDDIKQCVEVTVHLIKQLYQEQSIDVGEKLAFTLETNSKQIEDELSLREPDLKDKFRIFSKEGKIHFVAATDCIALVKKKLKQMLVWQERQVEVYKELPSQDLRLTELELEFIMKPEVVSYIDDKLVLYQFKLSADCKSMSVCCIKKSNLDRAVAEVKDCIKRTIFDMSNEPLLYNLSPEDLKKMLDVQEVLHGGKLLIKVDAQRKRLFMVYTDDVQEVVLSKLEEIKMTCSDITEVLPFTKEVWDQVKMIYPEDLHTIETEDVKLQYDAQNGIEVTGHKDMVDQAMTKLKTVAQKVHHEPFSFPEGTDILQTNEGQELLRKIEKRDGCMITLQENERETDPKMTDKEFLTMLHMKQTHDCVKLSQWTSDQGSSITVIQGSTKDMCAGTLVVPVVRGELPQDFGHVRTDPALREKFENLKKARDDPIFTDSSHFRGIKCNSVVFFNIPSTLKDGKDKEKDTVHATVKNIIKQARKKTSSRDTGLVFVLETIFKEGLDAAGVKCIIRGAQEAFKEMTSSIDVQLLTDGRNSSDVMKTLEYAGKGKMSVLKKFKNIGKKLKLGKDKPSEQSKTLIKIAVGRLEKRKVDVLVNSAHQKLDLTQRVVSRALNKATNGQLQRECTKRFPNGINPGEVAITNFQDDPSKITSKVFHGVLWQFPHGYQSDVTEQECWQVMQEFIYNCLLEASKLGVMSIAFPILGAGTLKYPAKRVAKVMFDTVEWFISVYTTSSIKLVEFVVYEGDKDIIQLFYSEYMSRSYHAKSFTQGVTARETRHVCGNVMLQFIQSDISKCEGMTDGLICIWENSQLQDPSKHPIVGQHLKTIEWNLYAQDMRDSGLTKTKGDGLPANIIFHTLLTDFKTSLSKGLKSAVDNHCRTVQFGVMAQGKTHDTKSLVADIMNILKRDDITCNDLCLFTVVVADEECYTSIVQQLNKSQGVFEIGFGILKTALAKVWPTGSQAVELATEVNDVGAQLVVSGTSAKHCKAVYEKVVEEMKQMEQVLNHNTPVTDRDDTETKQKVFGKCTAEHETIVIRDGNWMQMKGELETFDLIIQKREGGQTYLEGSFSSLSKAHTLLCKQGYMSVASNDETYVQEENKDTGKDSGITITKVHYDAVMHLIGVKELERFCQFEDTSSGEKKVCFIQGPGHLDEVQTLQQRIQGVIQDEIDLSKLEQVDVSKDKAMQVAKAVMKGIQDVYVKYAEDRKAMIMFAEDWNKMSRAKKQIPLQFGQGKPVSRLKRRFAAPDSSDKLDSTKHGSISVVTESGASIAEGQNFTVKVYNESIVSLALDVIVSAANGQLSHGGGVARIIAKAAGQQLEDEGNSIVLERGDIPVTDLAVTNSGNLPCKRVFHAVGPRWSAYTDKERCLEDLCCTILRCLCEAVNRSFNTIAFPSISSSIFGVPKEECAKMYVRALKSFDTLVERGSVKEVHFVDVSDTMVNIIQTELQNTWSQPGKKENLTKDRAFIMKCLDSNTSASVTTLEVTPGEHKEKDHNAGAHWLGKGGSVSLRVVKDDILKVDADAILSWEDTSFSTTSPLHKLMNDAGGESYRGGRDKAYRMHKSQGDIAEGPGGSLPQKHVIFAIISSSAQNEDTSKCLKKALDSCVKNKMANLILTKPSSKSAHRNVDITFIETTVDQLIKLDQDEKKPTLYVQIVDNQQHVVDGLMHKLQQYLVTCALAATAITSKETEVQGGEDCVICCFPMPHPVKLKCGHQFCKQCVDRSFKIKAVCPVCKMKCRVITGNMPHGTMRDRVDYFDLPGYEGCGTIIIKYDFNGGHQTAEHPDPGQWYRGFTRMAYLPNKAEGQKVLSLLKVAWKRRLTFTIGRSVTMGNDSCIAWNEIRHKTNTSGGPTNHGYPDPDYLKRVQEELADQGVTEEDLGATGTSV